MGVESIQTPKPFQAEYEGSIPFTRSSFYNPKSLTDSTCYMGSGVRQWSLRVVRHFFLGRSSGAAFCGYDSKSLMRLDDSLEHLIQLPLQRNHCDGLRDGADCTFR